MRCGLAWAEGNRRVSKSKMDFWVVPVETIVNDAPTAVNIAVLASSAKEAIDRLLDAPKILGEPIELEKWLERKQ